MFNPVKVAWMEHKATEEKELQARAVLARDLYAGTINAALLKKLAASFLSGTAKNVTSLPNMYAVVVDGIADRLAVDGWQDAAGVEARTAAALWAELGMETRQHELYNALNVDGEAFLLILPETEYESGAAVVKTAVTVQRRYTSSLVSGDNEGMKAHYKNGRLIMASKRWVELYYKKENGRFDHRCRMTLYLQASKDAPAHIEKYEVVNGIPIPYEGEVDAGGIISWKGLPFPVIHLRLPDRRGQGARATGGSVCMTWAPARRCATVWTTTATETPTRTP